MTREVFGRVEECKPIVGVLEKEGMEDQLEGRKEVCWLYEGELEEEKTRRSFEGNQ